ncbi:hypothetical protein COCMIDRAFT_29260 [Bipolaris oryzae ATCC 44560]|uniref:Uncharacterized protein n=1 Tax=Bipolaris oryzae ATCC 44560 TaxID=930090 RepID=W6Z340_COCMI|nr:uncharacterized protein COCMIDRAFT_29260 [Bipolaris oryzae ATCC 44560]EUC42079.1 hypothetical protein COCMIDRAFT_29260 [Bipolaris oryzae ATCC 44560]
MEEGLASNAHVSGSNLPHSFEASSRQLKGSRRNVSGIDAMRHAPVFSGTIDTAVIHLTIVIRAARMQAKDALGIAIEALKNLGITVMMKAAVVWIKSHPWEIAALIVPVLLAACTPAFLGLAGFTAGGIAAGSIAAATLTSAATSGYGVSIILGGVWGISSVVCWGLAAWKKAR